VDWLFSGLGTFIIGLIFGGGGGAAIGYRIAIRSTQKQSQKARDNATQTMIGRGDMKDSRGR
jgi:hypothetical protein